MKHSSTICYVAGRGQSYSHPAHARRFPCYAERAGLSFYDYDTDGGLSGDITIITQTADLSVWKRKKLNSQKLVFDANDPYLLPANTGAKSKLRGLAKYVSGRHRYFDPSYRELYKAVCLKSDAVVVSHFAQRQILETWGVHAFQINDYPPKFKKITSAPPTLSNGKVNIFWEGLGSSFLPFELIEAIFTNMSDPDRYRFHFVTDLTFYSYMDKFFLKNIEQIGRKSAPRMSKFFRYYQWTPETFNEIATASDLAIIPLPLDYSMNYWKPENKLIQLWRTGIPVIASAIPSYRKVFELAGIDAFCTSRQDWVEKLELYTADPELRRADGAKGFQFANEHYSNEKIDEQWAKLLAFVS